MSKSMDMVKTAYQALDKKLAEDIRVIDISEVSVLADYFIIANGANINQVQAIADEVLENMGQAGYQLRQIEGYQSAIWILMDFSDVVIHVFSRDDRRFYDLERIWRDGKVVEMNENQTDGTGDSES